MGKRSLFKGLSRLASEAADLIAPRNSLLFGDFAAKYLEEKWNNPELRESTKKAFDHQITKNLIPNFGRLPLDGTAWAVEFDKWVLMTRKENEGNKNPHVRRFFNAKKDLNEVLLFAFHEGHIKKKVRLKNPDEKRETGRWVTDQEVIKILWKARRPFRFVFYTFWKMGCRPREILRWQWDFFKWGDAGKTWLTIPSRISKTDRTRRIPLNPGVCRILAIRHARAPDGAVFVFPLARYAFTGNDRRVCDYDQKKPHLSYHSAWHYARIRAGVAKAVPYDMRRSIVSRWLKEKMPIEYAARLLDSSPDILRGTYGKFDDETMESLIK